MPIGFIDMMGVFKNYKEDKKKKAMKKKEDKVMTEPGDKKDTSSGPDYNFLMGYANGKRSPYPCWWTCDKVLMPVNIESREHWVLIVMDLRTWDVTVYDSYKKLKADKEVLATVEALGENVIRYLDAIGYWRHVDEGRHVKGDTTEFLTHMMENVPQQDGFLGDCGVWVCRTMEKIAYAEDYEVDGDTALIASDYRQRMIDTFFSARFDWEPPEPPLPPPHTS